MGAPVDRGEAAIGGVRASGILDDSLAASGGMRNEFMKNVYPAHVQLDGDTYEFEKILKEDFFSVNALYRNAAGVRYVLKLSDFRFLGGRLLRPIAVLMSVREYRIYRFITGISGIPPVGPRYGQRGFFHRYIEGRTLHELTDADRLPDDFFDRLRAVYDALHARRVLHIDAQKQGNFIWGSDGGPHIIDFQIAVRIPEWRGLIGRLASRAFEALRREDLYHVYKHKKHFRPDLLTADESKLATRTRVNSWLYRWVGRPYRALKRKIYPSGSNDIIWYRWKRLANRSRRMP